MVIEKSPLPTVNESANTSSVGDQLLQSLKSSRSYRHAFVEEKVRSNIAAQISANREQRGMKQPELARVMVSRNRGFRGSKILTNQPPLFRPFSR